MPGQKIVVIGDEDAVFGLGLIGLEGPRRDDPRAGPRGRPRWPWPIRKPR